MDGVRYNFWGENRYTDLLEKDITLHDRKRKIDYISEEILRLPFKSINWLDVGTGDGSKIGKIIDVVHGQKPDLKINLVICEPNKIVTSKIVKNLQDRKNVSFKIISRPFSDSFLRNGGYHCISLFHSTYEINQNGEKLKQTYEKLYGSLTDGGLLLIQEASEESDFNKLGGIKYISTGENTFRFFNKLMPKETSCKLFPTRIKIKNLIKNSEELIKFYKFVTQKDSGELAKKDLDGFILRVKKISREFGEKDDLDFLDLIVSVHKE